jgi:hypothetical protein
MIIWLDVMRKTTVHRLFQACWKFNVAGIGQEKKAAYERDITYMAPTMSLVSDYRYNMAFSS